MASWTIGRAPENDIVIPHASVSRRHAELRDIGGGRYALTDLGSSNGTMVQGSRGWARIRSTEVYPDEPLRFGEHETTVDDLLAGAGAQGTADDAAGGRRAMLPPIAGQAGLGAAAGFLDGLVPALSPGLLQAAGIACFVIAGLSLVFGVLNFTVPGFAAVSSVVQMLLGLAWAFVLLVFKKQLNEAFGVDRADTPLTILVIFQVGMSVIGVLFGILALIGLGVGAAAGGPGGAAGGLAMGAGLFAILMVVLWFGYGVLLIVNGAKLLKAKEQLGGLFAALCILLIVAGGLYVSVLLAVLGFFAHLAIWIVLGIQLLQWAGQPQPGQAPAAFD